MSAFDTAPGATPLPVLFDEHYLRFWQPELEGARLQREVGLVQRLGGVRAGDRVLDVACGFGRIATELARLGMDVTGVDTSAPLLAEARRRADAANVPLSLSTADMRDLSALGEFDCVLLWFTSFGYFDDEQNRRVLDEVRGCLKPGGRLLLETRHWDGMNRRFEPTTVRLAGDDLLIERHRYVPLTGVQETLQTLIVGRERQQRRSALRRYGVPELRALCLSAGFSAVHAFDEHGAPLMPESERCVLVAQR